MTDDILPAPGGKLVEGPIAPIRIAVLTVSDTRDEDSAGSPFPSDGELRDMAVQFREGHGPAVEGQ
ncbi:hypothetical protein [Brevundimonas sp.]|uniref:hypothetical protein n=1 Tax=Brevundimonas sp. TaxID=1871086 RepID=UPI001A2A7C34|nr:hypothetical protein [Brevundimonas sp.]MBJ7486357.1 hypothetical protein [Brevundimonas sp.]